MEELSSINGEGFGTSTASLDAAGAVTLDYIDGGITAVSGVRASGVYAGFRKNPDKNDLALITFPEGTVAAGVYTRNIFCAAPVTVSRAHTAHGHARAILINSGNANAATGTEGLAVAEQSASLVACALDISPEEVLVASTGVIGVPLSLECIRAALPCSVAALGPDDGTDRAGGNAAARAIMTTDTKAKEVAATVSLSQENGTSVTVTVAGMCKGSGMIMPDMATMIGVLTTDALLTPAAADAALRAAIDVSFNKVTVDSDTSTNDTVFLAATGVSGGDVIDVMHASFPVFAHALAQVCEKLARMIAADGEGASKLITVEVTGASSASDADLVARAIANSPLVKTAIAGHDANWGRIAMAAGKSGAQFAQEHVAIDIMGLPVLRQGLPVVFSEEEAIKRFEESEIVLHIDLGAGNAATRIWTCDFTHDYISINADYRT